MNVFNVLVIGAGNLGCRYVQGLSNSCDKLNIHIVDPNNDNLNKAEILHNERKNNNIIIKYNNLDKVPKIISLIIIATTASVRETILSNILKNIQFKYMILEKIVFQRKRDFIKHKNLCEKFNIKVWVNCCRREFEIYKKIKKIINNKNIKIQVIGNNWGMGSNAIHFIDLMVYLTDIPISHIDNKNLYKRKLNSKRAGYKEVKGELLIKNKNGDLMTLIDKPTINESFNLKIETKKEAIIINEESKFINYESKNDNYTENFTMPMMSEMIGPLVDKIIRYGKSDLPSWKECMDYHKLMIESFNEHFTNVYKEKIERCPIT